MGFLDAPIPSPRIITAGTSADIKRELEKHGVAYLGLGSHLINEVIELESGQGLLGLGQGLTTCLADPALASHMITNKHRTETGDAQITIRGLSLNGNKAGGRESAKYDNLHLQAAHGWLVADIESYGADRDGLVMQGNGAGGELASRSGRISNIFVHDNTKLGLWLTEGMRGVNVVNAIAENNGSIGFQWDASECSVYGAYAFNNGPTNKITGFGHLISNTFGCSYHNLVAAHNGTYGIVGYSLVGCLGTGWKSQSNGKAEAEEHPANPLFDDIAFLAEAISGFSTATYGVTSNTKVSGIQCGWEPNYYGVGPKERYALSVAAGQGPLELLDVTGIAGVKGKYLLPAESANLYFEEIS
jgi:hypothetical protein